MAIISKEYEIFSLKEFVLQSGITIPEARLAYKTYGTLNVEKNNVILYPTWYSGFHTDNEWLIGSKMALNPEKYFIIVLCALGNGQSSSPSNTEAPYSKEHFPAISLYDNIALQYHFVVKYLGIRSIKLVVGWSMGAQQAFQWGCLYPNMIHAIAPFCGSAKTSPHNFVFLEGVKAALIADCAWKQGKYDQQPIRGLKSLARVYAG